MKNRAMSRACTAAAVVFAAAFAASAAHAFSLQDSGGPVSGQGYLDLDRPAQVPDQLNHAPDWTAKCAAAQKDWRKIDLIFPDKK